MEGYRTHQVLMSMSPAVVLYMDLQEKELSEIKTYLGCYTQYTKHEYMFVYYHIFRLRKTNTQESQNKSRRKYYVPLLSSFSEELKS